ncbi:hypothetical protein CEXT_696211 [Caerostris extrusa]|uniref:Uncharacterized protein n=1 Tax=Caerostris extrusa TaxID=172846 RepID=A0AAV4XFY5_CAEEX|nr:hypothetical protein CEXT_696211 [Caerostris extrusa]
MVDPIKRAAFFPEVNSFPGCPRLEEWNVDYGETSMKRQMHWRSIFCDDTMMEYQLPPLLKTLYLLEKNSSLTN